MTEKRRINRHVPVQAEESELSAGWNKINVRRAHIPAYARGKDPTKIQLSTMSGLVWFTTDCLVRDSERLLAWCILLKIRSLNEVPKSVCRKSKCLRTHPADTAYSSTVCALDCDEYPLSRRCIHPRILQSNAQFFCPKITHFLSQKG